MKTTTFGTYIRFLRLQNEMTQTQLADKLNITDKAVSKWERDLSYPDIKLFPKLADVLGYAPEQAVDEYAVKFSELPLVRENEEVFQSFSDA